MATTIIDSDITVPVGTSHLAPRAIPAGTRFSFVDVTATRDNWPAQGVTVSAWFSYDNGNTYQKVAEQFVPAPTGVNPKTGTIDPMAFGFGWSRDPQPTHAYVGAVSPSRFNTHLTVTVR